MKVAVQNIKSNSGDVKMVWLSHSGDVKMVWFWLLARCRDGLVLFPREAHGLFRKLRICKRLSEFISIKIVWFGLLGRRYSDLSHSGDAVSCWPLSGDVIRP